MADSTDSGHPEKAPRPKALPDQIEEIIINRIRELGLPVGAALPKEEDLAKELHVSRNAVREGLARLKALGVIESRRRRGMVLLRPDIFSNIIKLTKARALSTEEQHDFMAMRCALELGMVDVIYRRKTPEALKQLREIATQESGYNSDPQLEIRFHGLMFSIGGNSLAGKFMEILPRIFRKGAIPKKHSPREETTHLQITDALEFGSLEEFRHTMFVHIGHYL